MQPRPQKSRNTLNPARRKRVLNSERDSPVAMRMLALDGRVYFQRVILMIPLKILDPGAVGIDKPQNWVGMNLPIHHVDAGRTISHFIGPKVSEPTVVSGSVQHLLQDLHRPLPYCKAD